MIGTTINTSYQRELSFGVRQNKKLMNSPVSCNLKAMQVNVTVELTRYRENIFVVLDM